MNLDARVLYLILGGGAFVVAFLIISAVTGGSSEIEKRLARVGTAGGRKLNANDRTSPNSVRSTKDSAIPLLDQLAKLLPNPDKLRARLDSTGRKIALGEYLLMNTLAILLSYLALGLTGWNKAPVVLLSIMLGLGLPHMVTGIMIGKRLKKFLANFPEAIDTMCRSIRSGLPVAEAIGAVGRDFPNPIGIEFRRISDGVRMGKTLEASMWEVAQRISAPEFRFLIIAMAIQRETGGNLAETLGNLSELIRKRRQLRLKIKAMSSEAIASASIIGSLPFIMFILMLVVNPDYVLTLFHSTGGKIMVGGGLFWMSIGWGVMIKMIHFEI